MTQNFYANKAMGTDFDHNPVISVQREQFKLVRRGEFTRSCLRILDLGCGGGTPKRNLDSERYEVVGADLSVNALTTYRSAAPRPVVQLDAQRLPFASGSFDIVVSDDVIEHVVDTDAYAREIFRVLVPNGWLFLSTPNLAAWFNRLSLGVGLQPAFTEVSFEKVFGRPGHEIVG